MKFTQRLVAFGLVLMVMGCSMKASDYEGTTPRFDLNEYFLGETRAWGIFEDRFGNLKRQFTVDIVGTMEGDVLVLDEKFLFDDGERDTRVWRVRKIDEHNYEGTADDVIGTARGESYGNALNWTYDLDLAVGERTIQVKFDDWMFLQPDGVLLNRAKVTKWGIKVGEVTLAFQKVAKETAAEFNQMDQYATAGEVRQAANQ